MITPEIIALAISAAVGILTLVMTSWVKRGEKKIDANESRYENQAAEIAAIRKELREENDKLRTRCDALEMDRDELRTKNLLLTQTNISLQAQVTTLEAGKVAMQGEIDKLRAEVADLRTGTGAMKQVHAQEAHIGRLDAGEVHAEKIRAKRIDAEAIEKKDGRT